MRVLAPHPNQDKAARDRFRAGYANRAGARGSVENRMAAFLKARPYSGRKMATQLRAAAAGCAGEVETRARRSIVVRLVATLQMMVRQIAALESEISQRLDTHPDREILRSFFRRRE